ncbi:O-methyltransferase [Trabulsiella odontotermitis]|uniref:O-methyltransferase n=1 Tax=Trabulsiella odontotermitis TaxID=379893 RepID=UPI000675C0AD|nr:O-methyltransferase [Trabulsiella odontotermitis]
MSKGNTIPYHLRHNKAVERNLFIDLLNKVNNCLNISDYIYVGFGGQFLEDFKIMHSALKIKKMISLEKTENTHDRQKFNMPVACVDIGEKPQTSGEFLTNYNFKKRTRHVVWLDYTEPSELNEQLNEVQLLCSKLNPYDIIKVTLNAHAETLGKDNTRPNSVDPREYRAERLTEILDAFSPYPLMREHAGSKIYPTTLLHALKKAMVMGVSNKPEVIIQPLSSFFYADGQGMLTATAVILESKENIIDKFFKKSRLVHWPFLDKEWIKPRDISVPVMSIKERLLIESKLPNGTPEEITKALGFNLAEDESQTHSQLKTFIEYQRAIPWFSKVQF